MDPCDVFRHERRSQSFPNTPNEAALSAYHVALRRDNACIRLQITQFQRTSDPLRSQIRSGFAVIVDINKGVSVKLCVRHPVMYTLCDTVVAFD